MVDSAQEYITELCVLVSSHPNQLTLRSAALGAPTGPMFSYSDSFTSIILMYWILFMGKPPTLNLKFNTTKIAQKTLSAHFMTHLFKIC